jgi:hypothetical protein
MAANTTAAKMLPKAMVFLPAALVVCCVGVLLALIVPFEVLVTANVVCAGTGTVVAPAAIEVEAAPVTRTAAVLDAPVVVAKTT